MDGLTLLEHVTAPDTSRLDAQPQIGGEAQGRIGARRRGDVSVVVAERPRGGDPAVVEDRLADDLHLGPSPAEARRRAHGSAS